MGQMSEKSKKREKPAEQSNDSPEQLNDAKGRWIKRFELLSIDWIPKSNVVMVQGGTTPGKSTYIPGLTDTSK